MEAFWQWITQNQESIFNYFKNIILFGLSILGVYFGWKGIRLALPNRHHKAKKEIISNLQKYLIENSNANATDIRSIVESSRVEHNLTPEIFTEMEIYRELRTSILTSHLVEGKTRETILNRLSGAEKRLSWDSVEKRIASLLGHGDIKALESAEGVEKIKSSILAIFNKHLELLQDYQNVKVRRTFLSLAFTNTLLLTFVGFLILMLIAITPIEVLQYYEINNRSTILMLVINSIVIFLMRNYTLKKLIEKLGTIGDPFSQTTTEMPRWMELLGKRFLRKLFRN